MIFSERYKLSEEAWKKWLTLHTVPMRRRLMNLRVETAFKAGFHMGVIRAEAKAVEEEPKQEFSASPHKTYKVSREGAQTLADMLDDK